MSFVELCWPFRSNVKLAVAGQRHPLPCSGEGCILLTESEVQRSFRQIVNKNEGDEQAFDRAEALLDELRPESPLRHRLFNELEELRKLAASKH